MSGRCLADFAVGQTFGSGRLRIDKEQIFAFAKLNEQFGALFHT